MKKIINNRLYDTETARLIGEDWDRAGSFDYWREELYRKRTGEYFLYGEGGARSRYARQVEQNTWSGGEKIIPLSYQAAQEWAEKHMSADDYMEHFGPVPEEDDGKEAINVKLSAAAAHKLRQDAAKAGVSLTDHLESLIIG